MNKTIEWTGFKSHADGVVRVCTPDVDGDVHLTVRDDSTGEAASAYVDIEAMVDILRHLHDLLPPVQTPYANGTTITL